MKLKIAKILALIALLPLCLTSTTFAATYSGRDCSRYLETESLDTYNSCMNGGGYDGSRGQRDCSNLSNMTLIERCLEENERALENNNPINNLPANYGSCDPSFLGLVPWHCNVKLSLDDNSDSEEDLTNNVIAIAGNVFTDITIIAAYLVLGYIIYGGYLYMFSSGDPSKAANGKKTLTHAFIGLAIVILSSVILNTIRLIFIGNNNFADCATSGCTSSTTLITNLIQWAIGVAGAVASIFVVIGGVGYVTSSGDASKLQKAKQTILFALIGLAIVGLAEVIVAFVSNLIQNAG